MEFWSLAYEQHWLGDTDEEQNEKLRQAVKTEKRPFGEISPEEYEEITGVKFIPLGEEKSKKSNKKTTKKDETITEEKKEEVKPVIEDNKTK